jgi:hypothetical protein
VEALHFVQEVCNMRLSHIVISLPVLFCAAQLSQPISLAQAATMDAAQATEMLAKSHAINVKCKVLDAVQSQNLKDFVARAEISLAEKASVSIARKAISSGKAQGAVAVCDDARKKLVNDVLAAASAAVATSVEVQAVANEPTPQTLAALPTAQDKPAEKPQVNAVAVVEPAPAPKPLKSVKLVKSPKPIRKVKVVAAAKPVKPVEIIKPGKGLNTYAAVAEKYYIASRCGTLSKRAITTLYSEVLANHQQALVTNQPNAVRNMLRSVEARAGAKSCT